MKILCLDIGDKWTGIAISDALSMFARPYDSVETKNLGSFLADTIKKENIKQVVVGYPRTLRGTESEQTKKVVAQKEQLEKRFDTIKWVLWDERLSSKRAEMAKRAKTKQEKIKSHALAAAFILETYLIFLSNQK